jgi:hypothetical protein
MRRKARRARPFLTPKAAAILRVLHDVGRNLLARALAHAEQCNAMAREMRQRETL